MTMTAEVTAHDEGAGAQMTITATRQVRIGADELTEEAPDRFLITAGRGYGSVGEPVTFADADDGATEVRYAGITMRPLPDLEEPVDHRLG